VSRRGPPKKSKSRDELNAADAYFDRHLDKLAPASPGR
jgi:hypothetical protein